MSQQNAVGYMTSRVGLSVSQQEALLPQTDRATQPVGRILANCCIAIYVNNLHDESRTKRSVGVRGLESNNV